MNIFSREDPPKYKPFTEKKQDYNTFFKIKDRQAGTRFKKGHTKSMVPPFKTFFLILKIISLLLCFQTRSLSEKPKEL
jgi:hypothetical protein